MVYRFHKTIHRSPVSTSSSASGIAAASRVRFFPLKIRTQIQEPRERAERGEHEKRVGAVRKQARRCNHKADD
jgi:hypothetical protein